MNIVISATNRDGQPVAIDCTPANVNDIAANAVRLADRGSLTNIRAYNFTTGRDITSEIPAFAA